MLHSNEVGTQNVFRIRNVEKYPQSATKLLKTMSLNFGEQINPHPSPLPSIQSQGVCLFVVFYWLEQQHNIAWRGWGRESDDFSFF